MRLLPLLFLAAVAVTGCGTPSEIEDAGVTRGGEDAAQGGDTARAGQTGITIHIDTAYKDTIRVRF